MNKVLQLIILLSAFNLNGQCWEAIDAGATHSLAIKSDGTLWTWGFNNYGQLGDGTNETKSTPTQIGTDVTWKKVFTGYYNSFAIKDDGTLWAWGDNSKGQLGDGTYVNKLVPTQIGSDSNWEKIGAGWFVTGGIKTDKSLWVWGFPFYSIGLGENIASSTPLLLGIGWNDICASVDGFAGIKTNGTLWHWGRIMGETNGVNSSYEYPTKLGNDNDWKKVAYGYRHAIALKNNGQMFVWGTDSYSLGLGGPYVKYTPTRVGTDLWSDIATKISSSAAIKINGSLWSWGNNIDGQLGDGTFVSKDVPVLIDNSMDWKEVKFGQVHAIANKNNNHLFSWGRNSNSLLGIGSTTEIQLPSPQSIICANLSINEDMRNKIILFPNPTNGLLNIQGFEQEVVEQIMITDFTGKTLTKFVGSDIKNIDLSNLATGTYLLHLVTNEKKYIEKIVKR